MTDKTMPPWVDDKHDGGKRGFTRVAKAWCASTSLPAIELEVFRIGVYHEPGGTTGEFCVCWERLGSKLTPRLKAFDDSWSALLEFNGLLTAMANVDGEDITPDQFHQLLLDEGIEDLTRTTES